MNLLESKYCVWLAAVLLLGSLSFAGCDNNEESQALVGVPTSPLLLASVGANACRVDLDCSEGLYCLDGRCAFDCADDTECRSGLICDLRGRCADAATIGKPRSADELVRNAGEGTERFTKGFKRDVTPYFISVSTEAGTVEIPYHLLAEVSVQAVDYRVETARCSNSSGSCQDSAFEKTVQLVAGENVLSFPYSGLEKDGDSLDIRFVGHGADLQTTLVRGNGGTGRYTGNVAIAEFAGAELPLEFDLVLSPQGANLANAEAVQLVWLPDRGPLSVHGYLYKDGFVVEMTKMSEGGRQYWDGFAQYDVDLLKAARNPAGIVGPRLFSASGYKQVFRTMLIELDAAEGQVRGQFSDRYTGMGYLPVKNGPPTRVFLSANGNVNAYLAEPKELERRLETQGAVLGDLEPLDLKAYACEDGVFRANLPDWGRLCTLTEAELPVTVNREACSGIKTSQQFQNMSVTVQRDCAALLLNCAISAPSAKDAFTGAWDDALSTGSTESASFGDLLDACRANNRCEHGGDCEAAELCATSPVLACARQAGANTLFYNPQDSYRNAEIRSQFLKASAEMSFGATLGAYAADTDLRLDWLKKQLAEDFSASFVRDSARDNLTSWDAEVLGPVVQSISGVSDVYATSVLVTMGANLDRAELDAWLTDVLSLWAKTVQDVAAMTDRWVFALDADLARERRYEYQQLLLNDFYLSAIVLSRSLKAVDAEYLQSMLTGLSGLGVANMELLMNFQDRVFARDAELFEDRSLTTVQGTALPALLDGLRVRTTNAVNIMEREIAQVIAISEADVMSALEVKNRFESELLNIFNELTETCGNPNRCQFSNYIARTCAVPIDPETCGALESDSGEGTGSLAYRSRLQFEAGLLELEIAESEVKAQQQREDIAWERLDQLIARVDAIDTLRVLGFTATVAATTAILEAQNKLVNSMKEHGAQSISLRQTLAEAASEAAALRLENQRKSQEISDESFAEQSLLQKEMEQRHRAYANDFERLTVKNQKMTLSAVREADRLRRAGNNAAMHAGRQSAVIGGAAQLVISGPFDVGAAIRGGLTAVSQQLAVTGSHNQTKANIDADQVRQMADYNAQVANSTFEIHRLKDVALLDLESAGAVETLRRAAQWELSELGLADSKIITELERTREHYALNQLTLDNQNRWGEAEIRHAMENVHLKDREKQAELQADKERQQDQIQIDAARADVFREATFAMSNELRSARAGLGVMQSASELQSVLNRAKLLDDRLRFVNVQLTRVASLQRSPTAFFVRSNDIRRAERSLQRARTAMIDLIVAAEYFAVRPFIEERIKAHASYSMAQIAKLNLDFEQRLDNCGGAQTSGSEVLSVRRDILSISGQAKDPVSELVLSEAEQFQFVMNRRQFNGGEQLYSALSGVMGDITSNLSRYYVIPVHIPIDGFSVLDTACNVRTASIGLDLVGDVAPQSGFAPLVHFVTAETGELRSCHTNVDSMVSGYKDVTNFGQITKFSGPVRVGPVQATVNGSGGAMGQFQYDLAHGRPLAGSYLLVIDTESSSNSGVDWQSLEDIVLTLQFSYQAPNADNSRCAP